MKLYFSSGQQQFECQVESTDEGIRCSHKTEQWILQQLPLENGRQQGHTMLILDNKPVEVFWKYESRQRLDLYLKGQKFSIERHLNGNDSKQRGANGVKASKDVAAVMPGKIVKVMVQPQDSVKQGDTLLVMEAMKMENEIQAAFDGVIEKVFVQPGESVENRALLVRFASQSKETN